MNNKNLTKNLSILFDSISIEKSLKRISHEIIEHHSDLENLAIIGIRTRGEIIAKRIASNIQTFKSVNLDFGILDITFYRDDVRKVLPQPILKSTEINFNINDKKIILVDDVFFSGRTIRSALNAINDIGRPKLIELCVLIDRGHRELPIRADYVGKNISSAKSDNVIVKVKEIDNEDIIILEKGEN